MKPLAVLPRVPYGALFVVAVPTGRALWAVAAAPAVALRRVQSLPAGVSLAAAGLILMALGARELIVQGRGLPMNAFPPAKLVRSGAFRWIRNPMSGLWLVTPVASLAAAALVYGFERPDMARRFGSDATVRRIVQTPASVRLVRWGNRCAGGGAHRPPVFAMGVDFPQSNRRFSRLATAD